MTRQTNKLTARTVAALSKPGRHGDGGGLYLFIGSGRKRWIFRFVRNGRAREMGLELDRGHFPAMPYVAAPRFTAELRGHETVASLALEFCILTACRSGEVLGAKWSEIDIDRSVWIIPASRMKAGVAHRVPLSEPAVAILNRMASIRIGEFIFPGRSGGLSEGAMARALAAVGGTGVTVHGFRSSFSSWAADCTMFQREVIEGALAHAVGNAVEAAYRGTDALEKRRALMGT